jgi:hypothetical protein
MELIEMSARMLIEMLQMYLPRRPYRLDVIPVEAAGITSGVPIDNIPNLLAQDSCILQRRWEIVVADGGAVECVQTPCGHRHFHSRL